VQPDRDVDHAGPREVELARRRAELRGREDRQLEAAVEAQPAGGERKRSGLDRT
jgi:hypothetical protein